MPVEFWCPDGGIFHGTATPCVKLLLPDICCGKRIMLSEDLNHGGTPFNGVIRCSILGSWCKTHMEGDHKTISDWEVIWSNFGPDGAFFIKP